MYAVVFCVQGIWVQPWQELPVYIYNMWVYGHRKQSSRDPLGDYVISFDYDADYKQTIVLGQDAASQFDP